MIRRAKDGDFVIGREVIYRKNAKEPTGVCEFNKWVTLVGFVRMEADSTKWSSVLGVDRRLCVVSEDGRMWLAKPEQIFVKETAGGTKAIDIWPVFDHSGFKLEDGKLRGRTSEMCNRGPIGFLTRLDNGTMLGRVSKHEIALALGFGGEGWEAVGWETVVLDGVRLTDEEWQAALDTQGV